MLLRGCVPVLDQTVPKPPRVMEGHSPDQARCHLLHRLEAPPAPKCRLRCHTLSCHWPTRCPACRKARSSANIGRPAVYMSPHNVLCITQHMQARCRDQADRSVRWRKHSSHNTLISTQSPICVIAASGTLRSALDQGQRSPLMSMLTTRCALRATMRAWTTPKLLASSSEYTCGSLGIVVRKQNCSA